MILIKYISAFISAGYNKLKAAALLDIPYDHFAEQFYEECKQIGPGINDSMKLDIQANIIRTWAENKNVEVDVPADSVIKVEATNISSTKSEKLERKQYYITPEGAMTREDMVEYDRR